MKIGSRAIGPNHSPFIIAEVAQSHEGSLGQAMAFIDVAANCGADAIKFQTHIPNEESTRAEPWRIKFSPQDDTRFEYWERMAFRQRDWARLKEHADEKGLLFLSSPFSVLACDWLQDLEVPAWKIASGEVFNEELLNRIEITKKPIILSSGLNAQSVSQMLVERFTNQGIDVALLHCTTMYPTPPEQVGLNVMQQFRKHFGARIQIGLSDHSGTPFPGIVAAYQGASILEAHLTLHPQMFGPDVPASLSPDQFKVLVDGVKFAWSMRQSPVVKDFQLADLEKEKQIFTRSLVAKRNLPAGHRITLEDISYKKPGGGMTYEQRDQLVGNKLLCSIEMDTILSLAHLSEEIA